MANWAAEVYDTLAAAETAIELIADSKDLRLIAFKQGLLQKVVVAQGSTYLTAADVLNVDISAYSTAGYAGTYIKTLYDDWLNGGRLDAILDNIEALVDSAEDVGPYSYTDAGAEQTVREDTAVTRRHVYLEVSNRNMTQAGTFKVYRKIDGTNYDIYLTQPTLASGERVWDTEFTTNQAWKITYTEDADEGAARDIPFNVMTEVKE